jgi:pimeloyl-ACP methyl ester carboxylesterase
MRLLRRLTITALVIYIAVCGVMYFAQDHLLYFPQPEVDRPSARALHLKSGDAVVKVWELHPSAGPALLYFGGNGDDVGAYVGDFDAQFPGYAIYLVNYRGYGGSTGYPSEAGLITDAQAVYDWVHPHHDRIVVMGRSLGTGIATALASTRAVTKLVLATPYDSVANVAADRFPWLPVRLLIKDRYDSTVRIGKVVAPVLVLVAQRDEVIARSRTDALVAAIPLASRHSIVIPAATHADIVTLPAYWSSVKAFLAP